MSASRVRARDSLRQRSRPGQDTAALAIAVSHQCNPPTHCPIVPLFHCLIVAYLSDTSRHRGLASQVLRSSFDFHSVNTNSLVEMRVKGESDRLNKGVKEGKETRERVGVEGERDKRAKRSRGGIYL